MVAFRPRIPPRPGDQTQRGTVIVGLAAIFGMLVISVLLGRSAPAGTSRAGLGVAVFTLFIAAGSVGAALGFLFGLPRARLSDQLTTPATNDADAAGRTAVQPASTRYLANSNLIKVSDWVTTIVIGLGLVNLGRAVPTLRELAAALRQPLGGAAYAGAIGISVLLGGALLGFLLTYLWTSIRVRELLEESERLLEKNDVPKVEGKTVREAREMLGETSLKLILPATAHGNDVIVEQSPKAGAIALPGAEVRVAV